MAEWLKAASEMDRFLSSVEDGKAAKPAQREAFSWFAFHLLNSVFDPRDPALSAEALYGRMDRPVDRHRWKAAAARLRAVQAEVL